MSTNPQGCACAGKMHAQDCARADVQLAREIRAAADSDAAILLLRDAQRLCVAMEPLTAGGSIALDALTRAEVAAARLDLQRAALEAYKACEAAAFYAEARAEELGLSRDCARASAWLRAGTCYARMRAARSPAHH